MNIDEAKKKLDSIIKKARIHLYKPIQIAEILYRYRVHGDIDLNVLESYRAPSRKWRDEICKNLLGRTSTSSAKFQDNLFEDNAIPPNVLRVLANHNENGQVEVYIYNAFKARYSAMNTGLDLVRNSNKSNFKLHEFIENFRRDPGLSRSVDKVFEIIVYAIFSSLLECLDAQVKLSVNSSADDNLLEDFSDFTEKVLGLSNGEKELISKPSVYRVGVTNAADRGLDMWANFGLAIQIKHLSLTAEMAEGITNNISADRIVIICKDCDKDMIFSILSQFGQKGKIQAIVTESELASWYEKGLRGRSANIIGDNILLKLKNEILAEFPSTEKNYINDLWKSRNYLLGENNNWYNIK
jgi:hypothetical protein